MVDTEGHERELRIGKQKNIEQLQEISTPCLDDHQFKLEELEKVGGLSKVCFRIVLKCFYLARIGRPDILFSVNQLARVVTKCTRACDRRLARLISYIHFTSVCRQLCHVGNTAEQCRLGLFPDADFAGYLEDSKSTSKGILCIWWQCHTVQSSLKLFHWTPDCARTVSTLWVYRTRLLKFCAHHQLNLHQSAR